MPTLLVSTIAAVFAAACLAPWLHRRLGDRCGLVLSLVPLAATAIYGMMIPGVAAGQPVVWQHAWVPALGINLDFRADGLSLLFLLLIAMIGTYVTWYAAGYLAGKKDLGKFYLYLFGFMGSMLGVVSADHLVLLFIFWELTSISSYLLIGYYHNEAKSRAAALQALLVTGAGGLCMLAGIILLGRTAGTFRISELLAMDPAALVAQPGFATILVLILLGAFTKSAQFPFHFWLPNAMEAPAPVSAYLHSATMVKAGVFLLARLHPLLSASPLWVPIVAPVGALTMMTGVFLALGQNDLKKILAYTTVAVLGTLTMLLGIGTELAVKAALAYLLAHALYKAALFMTAGTVDHETGTRDPDHLGGLRRAMPFTATAALIGALSMAGLPFLLGFVSKEYFYKALLDADGPGVLWEALGVTASIMMVALALTAGIKPFWGRLKHTPKHPHEAPWTMWLGPLLLGAGSLKLGLLPGLAAAFLIGPATIAVLGEANYVAELKLWHGLTVALGLSVLTVAAGIGLYFLAPAARRARGFYEALGKIGPERGYELLLEGTLSFARWQTRLLQNGNLRSYILTVALFTVALLIWLLPGNFPVPDLDSMVRPHVLTVTVCALIIAGALFACFSQSRFNAILALGVVGLGVAMIYFMFSAPDLAMTQVLVETLTLVLFVLAFYRLPVFKNYSRKATKLRDALVAGALFACFSQSRFNAILALGVVGLGVAMIYFMFSAPDLAMTQVLVETLTLVLFVLAFYRLPVFKNYSRKATKLRDALVAGAVGTVMATVLLLELGTKRPEEPVSAYMGENSLELANGRNVVNVILVDFRALDTLGEISVLGIAALGVWAMLRLRPGRGGKEER